MLRINNNKRIVLQRTHLFSRAYFPWAVGQEAHRDAEKNKRITKE